MGGDVVAITGATGFLGRRLTEALLAQGRTVRALVRRDTDAKDFAAAGVEPIPGDLDDAKALGRLVDGAGLVIHGAGLIKARSRSAFFAVNEGGARRVAQASAGPLILISSLAAREPALSDYAASKRAGEAAMRESAEERLTIVRPPAIYGPGDRETLPLFQAAGGAPVLPLLGGAGARLALAHVDDVVATILFLAGEPPRPGPWAVGGDRPEGYGWSEILTAAARAMGRPPRLGAPARVADSRRRSRLGIPGPLEPDPADLHPGQGARASPHGLVGGAWGAGARRAGGEVHP